MEKLQQELINERELYEKSRLQLLQEKEDLSHQLRSESIVPSMRSLSLTQSQTTPPQRNQSVGDLLRPLPNILIGPATTQNNHRTGFSSASGDNIFEVFFKSIS